MKEIIVNAQWQGGADLVTFEGAKELTQMYLAGQPFITIPVSTDRAEVTEKKRDIIGFDVLHKQMNSAYEQLSANSPDKIFTLGGGCDADVPGIVYLSEKYQGDLTVLWLDAHGDLNTPGESVSSLFYGMPLRSLMDDTCFGLLRNKFPLSVSQIIHVGGRDFDESELDFIKKTGLTVYPVGNIHSNRALIHKIDGDIKTGHIYIHLDLDAIDPVDFPNTPLPVNGGLHCHEIYDILDTFTDRLVGFGVYEYAPAGSKSPFMEKLIQFGLAL